MRTINGKPLIDDSGNFDVQVWLESAIAVGELLSELQTEDSEGKGDE